MSKTALRLSASIPAMLLAVAGLVPAAAHAQGAPAQPGEAEAQVTEVIVTAQRRSEASRDVPITVTTLNQEQLAVVGAGQLSDITKLTPALRFDASGSFVQPTIRGVGTAVTTSGGGPNVGIYVDGFFQSNSQVSDFQLMRVQNIQVLKGPQGTLFGRNTTGGAILVTTADPSADTSAEVKAVYGRFDSLSLQGYATHGLGDRAAFDIEGLYRRGDGFKTNIVNGDDEVGRFESWSVRTGLKFELTDNVSALLRYTHTRVDDPSTLLANAYVDRSGEAGFFRQVSPAGQAAYGRSSSAGLPLVYFFAPPGTFTTDPDEVANSERVMFRNTSDVFQARVNADLGFADLTSYSQFRRDRSVNHQDLDATALPLFLIYIGVQNRTVSQEFVLNSKPGGRLQWTAGANYYENRDTWDIGASFSFSPFFPFGGSSTTTKSWAGFFDGTYEVNDRLFLTAGLRVGRDRVTDAFFKTNAQITGYEGPNGEFIPVGSLPPGSIVPVEDLENDSVTPRLVVRYKPSDASSVYASYTRGYKAGILNVGGLSQRPVKPENIDAYEIGYKFANRALSLDLSAYYYDYENLQVSSFQAGAARITNAATSEIYGVEGQLRYQVTPDFSVTAGAGWTHARYKSFPNAPYYNYCDPVAPATSPMACGPIGPGSLTQTTIDASGLKMQRAPAFTGNLSAVYGLDVAGGRLTLSGNLYYSSDFYFDPAQQFKQEAYEVLSLRAQWVDPSERYSVAVFGDNLTDSRYQNQVLFNTLGIGGVWNAPPTWGVEVGAKF